jgi:hypothetical protein
LLTAKGFFTDSACHTELKKVSAKTAVFEEFFSVIIPQKQTPLFFS